jgi:cell division control protein 11
MACISYFKIPIYDFPVDPNEDDEDTVQENNECRSMLPFSVIGMEHEVKVGGLMKCSLILTMLDKSIRCRSYPWGRVEVDNEKHCDFSKLRYILLRYRVHFLAYLLYSSHLQDLKEVTHEYLYENFRTERLSQEAHSGHTSESVLV